MPPPSSALGATPATQATPAAVPSVDAVVATPAGTPPQATLAAATPATSASQPTPAAPVAPAAASGDATSCVSGSPDAPTGTPGTTPAEDRPLSSLAEVTPEPPPAELLGEVEAILASESVGACGVIAPGSDATVAEAGPLATAFAKQKAKATPPTIEKRSMPKQGAGRGRGSTGK